LPLAAFDGVFIWGLRQKSSKTKIQIFLDSSGVLLVNKLKKERINAYLTKVTKYVKLYWNLRKDFEICLY